MVLGLRTKSRRGATIQVEYIIYIQEIKPWPPSHSLRSLRSVLLKWENGERISGCIGPVVPSIGSVVGEGRIEFNESIKLSVALSRELSSKGGNVNSFQKNCLELNLYEPRRDKSNKGQHLASATVDLAEYATIKGSANLSIPMNSKRSVRNTAQPSIFLKIQLSEKDQNNSSSRESPSKEVSLDGKDSVSALMSEEYAEEEAEIASFTDEDVSSHSSLTIHSTMDASGSSISENGSIDERNLSEQNDGKKIEDSGERKSTAVVSLLGSNHAKSDVNLVAEMGDHASLSSQSSSLRLPDYLIRQGIGDVSFIHNPTSTTHLTDDREVHQKSSVPLINSEGSGQIDNNCQVPNKEDEVEDLNGRDKILPNDTIVDKMTAVGGDDTYSNVLKRNDIEVVDDAHQESEDDVPERACENGEENVKELCSNEDFGRIDIPSLKSSSVASVKSSILTTNTSSVRGLKNMIPLEGNESNFVESAHGQSKSMLTNKGRNDRRSRHFPPEKVKWLANDINHQTTNNKLRQLEQRVECLESELQEAASLELSLYSIVAEHGSSTQKVHAPARRLSRLYTYSLKQWRRERRANSAKSIVSGLFLVAKACGHDVPRLTFWLSNSIVLRTIISRLRDDFSHCSFNESCVKRNGFVKESGQKAHHLKWNATSDDKTREKNGEWEDPCTFISMLENLEGWIFSRIIESIWWQSLTPHMQCPISNELDNPKSNKNGGRACLSDQQLHFSLTLWKKAFKEACERICPVRAAGHECGCLAVLARLVMEQCVNRLDVAMFNAILRESEDDIPTDPVSDPIGDPRVLPIPSGKTSFGAGAQLKNALGNWSRWLTDLFGIDDDESFEDNEELNHESDPSIAFKTFYLLNALSDLLMLPKDMLLDKSIWREICPTFAAPMVKRILETYVEDEFCSDPIPESLFEALESEEFCDETEELISNFPCDAVPVIYKPPSAATISRIIGDVYNHSHLRRSTSSVLRKGQTSDDELQELELPLTSVFLDTRQSTGSTCTLKGADKSNVVRFGLLRDVWRDGD